MSMCSALARAQTPRPHATRHSPTPQRQRPAPDRPVTRHSPETTATTPGPRPTCHPPFPGDHSDNARPQTNLPPAIPRDHSDNARPKTSLPPAIPRRPQRQRPAPDQPATRHSPETIATTPGPRPTCHPPFPGDHSDNARPKTNLPPTIPRRPRRQRPAPDQPTNLPPAIPRDHGDNARPQTNLPPAILRRPQRQLPAPDQPAIRHSPETIATTPGPRPTCHPPFPGDHSDNSRPQTNLPPAIPRRPQRQLPAPDQLATRRSPETIATTPGPRPTCHPPFPETTATTPGPRPACHPPFPGDHSDNARPQTNLPPAILRRPQRQRPAPDKPATCHSPRSRRQRPAPDKPATRHSPETTATTPGPRPTCHPPFPGDHSDNARPQTNLPPAIRRRPQRQRPAPDRPATRHSPETTATTPGPRPTCHLPFPGAHSDNARPQTNLQPAIPRRPQRQRPAPDQPATRHSPETTATTPGPRPTCHPPFAETTATTPGPRPTCNPPFSGAHSDNSRPQTNLPPSIRRDHSNNSRPQTNLPPAIPRRPQQQLPAPDQPDTRHSPETTATTPGPRPTCNPPFSGDHSDNARPQTSLPPAIPRRPQRQLPAPDQPATLHSPRPQQQLPAPDPVRPATRHSRATPCRLYEETDIRTCKFNVVFSPCSTMRIHLVLVLCLAGAACARSVHDHEVEDVLQALRKALENVDGTLGKRAEGNTKTVKVSENGVVFVEKVSFDDVHNCETIHVPKHPGQDEVDIRHCFDDKESKTGKSLYCFSEKFQCYLLSIEEEGEPSLEELKGGVEKLEDQNNPVLDANGIDVHANNWVVTGKADRAELPEALANFNADFPVLSAEKIPEGAEFLASSDDEPDENDKRHRCDYNDLDIKYYRLNGGREYMNFCANSGRGPCHYQYIYDCFCLKCECCPSARTKADCQICYRSYK
ncbi:Hypp4385 [Branchiostoma lanceolatum]|uniref:Hypp4385 protein n=1 Tax=Branchiostoma lanceolatum TaxID=7740 RepID=A0A8K0A8P0_BRALA|nr:Hypp4385 [Branchiostoma lanceolatum]